MLLGGPTDLAARLFVRGPVSADGMDVTANFERYARPLIAGEEPMTYVDGIPARLAPLA